VPLPLTKKADNASVNIYSGLNVNEVARRKGLNFYEMLVIDTKK
jgi:hypothetical protein